MNNVRRSDQAFESVPDPKGLDAARGLMIGLALSQIFWIALAFLIF